MTPNDACAVLNAAQHRGARNWMYDAALRRVTPAEWAALEAPPVFTAFEAVTIARGLVRIGAYRCQRP